MSEAYYHRSHLPRFAEIGEGNRDLADKYFAYYGAVFADGALSVREKALQALAVAHAVQCPYCIDAYTSGSLEAGADLEQMTEAVQVAAAVRGGSVLAYGMQMLGQAGHASMGAPSTITTDAYFAREHDRDRARLAEGAPELEEKFSAWDGAVFGDAALSVREKHLVALAVAHALQCPYSIDRHTRGCQEEGCSLEEMTEAVHVANAIRGGASLVHGIQMLDQATRRSM